MKMKSNKNQSLYMAVCSWLKESGRTKEARHQISRKNIKSPTSFARQNWKIIKNKDWAQSRTTKPDNADKKIRELTKTSLSLKKNWKCCIYKVWSLHAHAEVIDRGSLKPTEPSSMTKWAELSTEKKKEKREWNQSKT